MFLPVFFLAIVVAVVVILAVPVMVVADLAVIAFPVSLIELLAIVTRSNPMRSRVSWTCPVSCVPLVVAAYRIPVAVDPGVTGARAARLNSLDPHRWRRADSHADGNLCEKRPGG